MWKSKIPNWHSILKAAINIMIKSLRKWELRGSDLKIPFEFYSNLTMEIITDTDYKHVKESQKNSE